MFYSNEEFNFQVQELMEQERYSFIEACGIVQQRMEQDEVEYNEWVVEQFRQQELDRSFNDMEVL